QRRLTSVAHLPGRPWSAVEGPVGAVIPHVVVHLARPIHVGLPLESPVEVFPIMGRLYCDFDGPVLALDRVRFKALSGYDQVPDIRFLPRETGDATVAFENFPVCSLVLVALQPIVGGLSGIKQSDVVSGYCAPVCRRGCNSCSLSEQYSNGQGQGGA